MLLIDLVVEVTGFNYSCLHLYCYCYILLQKRTTIFSNKSIKSRSTDEDVSPSHPGGFLSPDRYWCIRSIFPQWGAVSAHRDKLPQILNQRPSKQTKVMVRLSVTHCANSPAAIRPRAVDKQSSDGPKGPLRHLVWAPHLATVLEKDGVSVNCRSLVNFISWA